MKTLTIPANPTRSSRRAVAPRQPRLSARNQAAIRLLDSLMNCSEEEAKDQMETFEFLKEALDQDRPGYRKLFPENNRDAGTR